MADVFSPYFKRQNRCLYFCCNLRQCLERLKIDSEENTSAQGRVKGPVRTLIYSLLEIDGLAPFRSSVAALRLFDGRTSHRSTSAVPKIAKRNANSGKSRQRLLPMVVP